MGTTSYNYDQNGENYLSCFDVVTSPLQGHYGNNVTVVWRSSNQSIGANNAGGGCTDCACGNVCSNGAFGHCGSSCSPSFACNCNGGACSCGGAGTGLGCNCGIAGQSINCCDDRYIEVQDLLVLVSVCPTGCLTCISATVCLTCVAAPTAYVLNYADKLCYLSCPQSTYANSTLHTLGNLTTGAYTSYTEAFYTTCVPCNKTCLECIDSDTCTRCFTTGRN